MLESFQIRPALQPSRRAVILGGAAGLLAALAPPLATAAEGVPQRVVSIGGATTEIAYALGQGARIVAVDSTSTYPVAAQQKPDVGYMRQLSAEGVLALRPDLILMEEGAGPPAAVQVIAAAGVPVVQVPAGHDPAAIAQKITTVADALGQPAAGAALAARLRRQFADLSAGLAAVKVPRRVLFVLSLDGGRPVAAGAGTGGDAIIRMAGGVNVFADAQGYKTVSPESAAALAPDVILMMENGGPSPGDAAVLAAPAIAATPAGRNRALIRMDALYLLGFGPRTAEAARDLAARLYPTLDLGARP